MVCVSCSCFCVIIMLALSIEKVLLKTKNNISNILKTFCWMNLGLFTNYTITPILFLTICNLTSTLPICITSILFWLNITFINIILLYCMYNYQYELVTSLKQKLHPSFSCKLATQKSMSKKAHILYSFYHLNLTQICQTTIVHA